MTARTRGGEGAISPAEYIARWDVISASSLDLMYEDAISFAIWLLTDAFAERGTVGRGHRRMLLHRRYPKPYKRYQEHALVSHYGVSYCHIATVA